jgi:glucokinase
VEAFVSGNGIKKLYGVSPTALADEHWEEVGYYLGEGLRNIAVAYAPAVIVIGGGLANGAGEKLLSPARQRLNTLLKILPIPEVILSTLGTDSVIIGAALLAKNGFKAY